MSESPAGDARQPTYDAALIQQQVRDHLVLNFTDMNVYRDAEVPIFVRGEGCEVIDIHGRRYIDGLSGLFCSNLGHSYGAEIGAAVQRQLAELPFTPTWYVAHPSAAALAERIAERAPEGMNRVFFTTGGGEANEAIWKMARQWHAANGQPQRRKAIARNISYHGTSLAALSFTGLSYAREPFMPMAIPVTHVSETNSYRHPAAAERARGVHGCSAGRDGAGDPRRRRRRGRADHRRAGAELRRFVRAAARLLVGSACAGRQVRDLAVCRRGDHRVRSRRRLVRVEPPRHRAGLHHLRQGRHRRARSVGRRRSSTTRWRTRSSTAT